MRRFLVFPALLAIYGACFIVLCAAQGVLPLMPAITIFSVPGADNIWERLSQWFFLTWKYGFAAGVVVGLLLALWDLVRNRSATSASNRLAPNLFWCFLYTLPVWMVNAAFLLTITLYYTRNKSKPAFFFLVWPFISAGLLNFTALLWAAIRSITTDDVLTPRVLRAKLRERMRLG